MSPVYTLHTVCEPVKQECLVSALHFWSALQCAIYCGLCVCVCDYEWLCVLQGWWFNAYIWNICRRSLCSFISLVLCRRSSASHCGGGWWWTCGVGVCRVVSSDSVQTGWWLPIMLWTGLILPWVAHQWVMFPVWPPFRTIDGLILSRSRNELLLRLLWLLFSSVHHHSSRCSISSSLHFTF